MKYKPDKLKPMLMRALNDIFKCFIAACIASVIITIVLIFYYHDYDPRNWPKQSTFIGWVIFFAFNILYNMILSRINKEEPAQQNG